MLKVDVELVVLDFIFLASIMEAIKRLLQYQLPFELAEDLAKIFLLFL